MNTLNSKEKFRPLHAPKTLTSTMFHHYLAPRHRLKATRKTLVLKCDQ